MNKPPRKSFDYRWAYGPKPFQKLILSGMAIHSQDLDHDSIALHVGPFVFAAEREDHGEWSMGVPVIWKIRMMMFTRHRLSYSVRFR